MRDTTGRRQQNCFETVGRELCGAARRFRCPLWDGRKSRRASNTFGGAAGRRFYTGEDRTRHDVLYSVLCSGILRTCSIELRIFFLGGHTSEREGKTGQGLIEEVGGGRWDVICIPGYSSVY